MNTIKRRCGGCDTVLASDHREPECGRCAAARKVRAPTLPWEFWSRPDIRAAFESRHIGRAFRAYRLAQAPTLSQTALAEWLDLTQGRVSEIERARRPVTDLERLERWCDGLGVPRRLRWFNGGPQVVESDDSQAPQEKSLLGLGLSYAASLPATVEVVAELGRYDMERRTFLGGALFSVAAAVGPSRDWLLATLEDTGAVRGKISGEQVAAIRRTFGVFQELDVMRGGGHARERLSAYLVSHVVPLLKRSDPASENGRALYEAAAEQLYLLGWMAFDNGEHPVAQRYLIQSLRLAQAAGSPELGAHVLAGLADQATLTGHPDHAVQLARTGRAGLSAGHSDACLADLWALQGRAEAAMGDVAAERSVRHSQAAFASVDPTSEPEWARFIDAAYLNGEYAHTYRDLRRPDDTAFFAEVSIAESERQHRARRGALAHAALARARLDRHDLEAATAAGTKAATLAATVTSSRAVDAVADLRVRLAEHGGSPVVREFMAMSAAVLPRSPG